MLKSFAKVATPQLFIECVAIIFLLCVSAPIGAQALPQLGQGNDMPVAAERRLGDRIARELYRDAAYLDDPILLDYLISIWQPLLQAARHRGELPPELDERFAWQLLLLQDKSINAFALPGGYFGIHTGLLAAVTNRHELASVLAHEMSHVTQRHIARLLQKQAQQAPWVLGALILGAMAASRSPDAGMAAVVGSQAMSVQSQLNFSRDMEREADRVGWSVMVDAGFEADGAVTMFSKLEQAARHNDNGAFPYLRSHPLTTERSGDMLSRLASLPARGHTTGAASAVDAVQWLMNARARVFGGSGKNELRVLRDEALLQMERVDTAQQGDSEAYWRRMAAAYTAVLASARLGEPDMAARQYHRLRSWMPASSSIGAMGGEPVNDAKAVSQRGPLLSPGARPVTSLSRTDWTVSRVIDLLGADIALASGAGPTMGVLLSGLPQPRPERGRPETLMRAQSLLQLNDAGAAAEILSEWLAQFPRDAAAWHRLSEAETRLNHPLRAGRAAGEALALHFDFARAVDTAQSAREVDRQQTVAGGATAQAARFADQSILDARSREWTLAAREQALER
jgi:predicted Zn-dependent protease